MRPGGGACLGIFDVEQGLRHRCVLAQFLLKVVLTAVLRVTEERLLADAAITDVTDSMMQFQRNKEKGGKKGKLLASKVDG